MIAVRTPPGSDEAIAAAFGALTFTGAWVGFGSGPWPAAAFATSVLLLFATAYHQQRRFREANGIWIAGAVWASGPHPGRRRRRARAALIAGWLVLFLAANALAADGLWWLTGVCSGAAALWVWWTSRWWMRLYSEEQGGG